MTINWTIVTICQICTKEQFTYYFNKCQNDADFNPSLRPSASKICNFAFPPNYLKP